MGEVLMAEWFDLDDAARKDVWAWLHKDYFPALQAAQGVAWVGHYEIVKLPDRPYIEGAPRRKQTSDPAVAPGWQNVVLTAAVSPDVFFGPGNAVDALRQKHAARRDPYKKCGPCPTAWGRRQRCSSAISTRTRPRTMSSSRAGTGRNVFRGCPSHAA
jgi:hypothetical protein